MPFIHEIAKRIVINVTIVSAAVRLSPRSTNVQMRNTANRRSAVAKKIVLEFQSFRASGKVLSKMMARVGKTTRINATTTADRPNTRT